jgi:ribose/xylose/arabinose/galactoside ABC-type transport system permease subunit
VESKIIMNKDMAHRLKILAAQYSTFGALLVLGVGFSTLNSRFLTFDNFRIVALNVAELGIVVVPVALLVMSGSVDLSIGSVASVSAVTSGKVMADTGSLMLGLLAGLGVGFTAGMLNGLLVAVLGLNPIVITIGFLGAWGGLALYITGGATVAGLPESFTKLARWELGPVPLQILLLTAVFLIGWVVLDRRPFGREVLAIGGNKNAAHLMGVRVKQVQFTLFVVTGMAAALSGIMLSGKLASAPPTIGVSMELNALLVVLIGGVAFEGGVGRISGVLAGLLFIGTLSNGLVIVGVSQFLQSMVTGIALVVAVALDSTIQRGVRKSWSKLGERELAAEEQTGLVRS